MLAAADHRHRRQQNVAVDAVAQPPVAEAEAADVVLSGGLLHARREGRLTQTQQGKFDASLRDLITDRADVLAGARRVVEPSAHLRIDAGPCEVRLVERAFARPLMPPQALRRLPRIKPVLQRLQERGVLDGRQRRDRLVVPGRRDALAPVLDAACDFGQGVARRAGRHGGHPGRHGGLGWRGFVQSGRNRRPL
jgi:hypothetical protein